MSRRFFHVSAAVLCLALAYHFGAKNAQSAPPGASSNPAVSVASIGNGAFYFMTLTASGDAYLTVDAGKTWAWQGNIFGNATPTGP